MQIVQSLRTRGGMDFDEISTIIPCLEMAGDAGVDVEREQPGSFRAYKTHFWRHDCPKQAGVRYIVVVRDPEEVRMPTHTHNHTRVLTHEAPVRPRAV